MCNVVACRKLGLFIKNYDLIQTTYLPKEKIRRKILANFDV